MLLKEYLSAYINICITEFSLTNDTLYCIINHSRELVLLRLYMTYFSKKLIIIMLCYKQLLRSVILSDFLPSIGLITRVINRKYT